MSACCHGGTAKGENPGAWGKYTCPMHPEIIRDVPGDCPLCGMALVGVGPVKEDRREENDLRTRFLAGVVLAVPVVVLAMSHWLPQSAFRGWCGGPVSLAIQGILATPVFLWAGFPFHRKAWKSILAGRANMFTLITLGTGAAWVFSVWSLVFGTSRHTPVYFEAAAMIIVLALGGQILEARGHRRAGLALRGLMDLSPAKAVRIRDGREEEVAVESLAEGDDVRIRPGEHLPVDGVVIEGRSPVEEAAMTGESLPVMKTAGDDVLAGTVNGTGMLVVRTTRAGSATMLGRIIRVVGEALQSRMPVQDLADRVAGWFVPAVLAAAIATFVIWMVFVPALALPNAVAVLIIACPCAIGLAVPMSVTVGLGRAAELGILVRDTAVLQVLARVNTIVFDKTGTLTFGRPRVTEVVPAGNFSADEILRLAAAVERVSEHPLAGAICAAAEARGWKLPEVSEFSSEPGAGVVGVVERRKLLVGSARFLSAHGIEAPDDEGVFIGIDGHFAGKILVRDTLRPEARETLAELEKMGLRTVMLTGDSSVTAKDIAGQAGVANWEAGLRPLDKADRIRAMRLRGDVVLMAGDGVNDAPALAVADVAAAMGAGTDIAKESAGLVLLKNNLKTLSTAVRLGRLTLGNIRQNLFFAFFYNILGIPIAAGLLHPFTGLLLSPMLAGAAMSLSSLTVIANALRLRRFPRLFF